jgi:arylsulfatase A
MNHSITTGIVGTTALLVAAINLKCSNQLDAHKNDTGNELPNIIVILADDLGYGDPGGYYGGRAETPHLERLAQEGMLFTDFHSNGPMCSPTRAALITGRYQQRLGIDGALPGGWESPGVGLIQGIGSSDNDQEITMAKYLKQAGYSTGFFGKWHLGNHHSANPVLHGFDEFCGLMSGCGDYFSKLDRFGYRDWWHNDKLVFQEGYTTNVITDNSVNFIKENKNNPFFLYVAHLAVHFPWQTPEDGNLETRKEGEDFTGNYPGPNSKLGPHQPDDIPEILIRMIQELDSSVGRIISTLRELGLDRNTLIFFTSDNGGYLSYSGNTWPVVGSNGPLRGQKSQLYEGGHRVPAIAWWPGKIPALSVTGQTVMTFDILPTVLDILEIEFPEKGGPNAFDGTSILPLLLRGESLQPRTLFWMMRNQKAVRNGQWKLIIPGAESKPELYNLYYDIGETNDLADDYPETVSKLISELESWENDVISK